MRATLFAVSLGFAFVASHCQSQDEAAPLFAEPKKDWVWDEDKRFDFLMERLASLEASLDAINATIAKTTGKKSARQAEAQRHEGNNTLMDRKAGGPMPWKEFYGTNAEKFFYHPVDPNTYYRTDTALRQMGSSQDDKVGVGVPATQSLPVHQRPPQWDYIYRANRDSAARAEDEARKLEGKLEELHERRFQLEEEQAELWARLAFRIIERLNIPRKPVLRFALTGPSAEPSDAQKARALQAAARFLSTALLVIDKAEKEQETALTSVKTVIATARESFDDELLEADAVAEDIANKETALGKYVALAQLLEDTANNLGESYEVAMEGEQANDEPRKNRFRGLLQRSLVEYAEILLALDELTGAMQNDWAVSVNTKNRLSPVEVTWTSENVGSSRVAGGSRGLPRRSQKPPNKTAPARQKPVVLTFRTEQEIEAAWSFVDDGWRLENGGIRFKGAGAIVSKRQYVGDFSLQIAYKGFLSLSACGSVFEGREIGESNIASLERRGDVLTFRTPKASPISITLKQAQKDAGTTIQIGNYRGVAGDVFVQSVQIVGTAEEAD